MKNRWKLLIVYLLCVISPVWAGKANISAILEERAGIQAEDLGDIAWDGSSIWVTGSGTLSNKLWGEGNKSTDWISFINMPGFGRGSMTALYTSGDTLMVAWRYDELRNDELITNGDGFSISFDRAQTWRHVTILDIFPDRTGLAYPGTYTTTYDISFSDGTLWCSTTAGFLLKSDDAGDTWEQILPDTDEFNFQNPNHHGQCVDAYGDTLWVGTFQGMNVSFDRGETWKNFSWPSDNDLPDVVMPGNFCVAVEHKVVGGKTHVWIGSNPYFSTGEYGICHTEDNGETWDYRTTNYSAWNFAFGHGSASNPAVSDSTVFAASDSGLVVSYDLGKNWDIITIRESKNLYWERDTRVFGVLAVADTLWVTGLNGLARSNDWGKSWNIYKQEPIIVEKYDMLPLEITVYGNFPNPFNPNTTIKFSLPKTGFVNIVIYNIMGQNVKELVAESLYAGDHSVVWDGKDENGKPMSAGIYISFIRQGEHVATHKMLLMK